MKPSLSTTYGDVVARLSMAHVAQRAPHALTLAAQLFGVAPCEKCNFIKRHCRCHEEGKGHE